VFVRLTGCNLRCTWCDTAYAFHGGKRMNVNEICHQVDELTGGEPLLQEGVYALAQTLLGDGYTVMIETSGERFIGKLPEHVIKIVDVKCPDSGAANTFEYRNLDLLSHNDEVKFVISSRKDYEFAREFTKKHQLSERVRQVLFSPVFDDPEGKWKGLEPKQLVEWILADDLPVRLGLQLHKFVWHPSTRGV
jgi:7-carboxy-7-deazaguanine synthase